MPTDEDDDRRPARPRPTIAASDRRPCSTACPARAIASATSAAGVVGATGGGRRLGAARDRRRDRQGAADAPGDGRAAAGRDRDQQHDDRHHRRGQRDHLLPSAAASTRTSPGRPRSASSSARRPGRGSATASSVRYLRLLFVVVLVYTAIEMLLRGARERRVTRRRAAAARCAAERADRAAAHRVTYVSVGLLAIGVVLMIAERRSRRSTAAPPLDLRDPRRRRWSPCEPAAFLWLGMLAVVAAPIGRVIVRRGRLRARSGLADGRRSSHRDPGGHRDRRRRAASGGYGLTMDVLILARRVRGHPGGRRAVHQRHRVVRPQARASPRARSGPSLAAVGTALPETMIPIIAILFATGASSHEVGVGAILGRAVHARRRWPCS